MKYLCQKKLLMATLVGFMKIIRIVYLLAIANYGNVNFFKTGCGRIVQKWIRMYHSVPKVSKYLNCKM